MLTVLPGAGAAGARRACARALRHRPRPRVGRRGTHAAARRPYQASDDADRPPSRSTRCSTPAQRRSAAATARRPSRAARAAATPAGRAATGTISIDDFTKVDLRIARIVNAEHVEGADKLLKLTLDIGEASQRTVFAGIKSAYDPRSSSAA